jgi:hypothetical protein
MTAAKKIEQLVANFCTANKSYTSTSSEMDKRVLTDALSAYKKSQTSKPAIAEPSITRTIMRGSITKFRLAAAAVVIIAVFMSIHFAGLFEVTSKVYGMSDVPELFRTAKTIHMKGRIYFPPSAKPGKEQSSVEVQYWLDMENGRWRLTYPGYSSRQEGIKIRVSESVSDGQYEMHINHADKTVSFKRLTDFQRKLFARRNRYTFFQSIYIDSELPNYEIIGQEIIGGESYDIWEGLRANNSGCRMRVRSWLSPSTGAFARIKAWTQEENKHWVKQMEIDLVERDIDIKEDVFTTEAPDAYTAENSKETATVRELTTGSVSCDSVSLHCHILFTMADGSVIMGWSSDDRQRDHSKAELFEDLKIGGQLPKTAAQVYAIVGKAGTYSGYHLAYTQRRNKFYEWSIYVPKRQVHPGEVSDYTLLHKYHPEDRDVNARMSLRVASELPINNREDFDTLVCGAMAELSDEAKAPEHVTYENVLRLVKQIRQSLSR